MKSIFGFFENKTILVTGATGLIGSHLVETILANTKSCSVIASGRNYQKLQNTFPDFNINNRLKIVTIDIKDKIELNLVSNKLDFIFHTAGPQERNVIINSPLELVDANIDGLRNCFDFLLHQEEKFAHRGRLVVFSSLTIYGNSFGDEIVRLTEVDSNRTGTLNDEMAIYSESKRMSEVLAEAYYRSFGLDYVACRLSTVYGHSKNPTKTAFFEFLYFAKEGKNISVQDRYGPKRDNIYIEDAVLGILYSAAYGHTGEIYNISSGGKLDNFLSVADIATIISETANKIIHRRDLVKVYFSNELHKPNRGYILDNTKLTSLGWSLEYSYREAISKIFLES
jgi:nucleoside-diphosphate-sugar epimerase